LTNADCDTPIAAFEVPTVKCMKFDAYRVSSKHQRMPASVRELADALQTDLIALRRSLLAAVKGARRNHPRLRREKTDPSAEDDVRTARTAEAGARGRYEHRRPRIGVD
jgi:hypothetical protein